MSESNEINLEAISSSVYVFNCYNESISALSVQFGAPVTIAGYATGPTPPLYTPAGAKVPRGAALKAGVFGVGSNAVTAEWDSFTGTFNVIIPDPKSTDVPLVDDLILFLMRNKAVLVTTRGYVLNTFDVELTKLKGEPLNAD